MTVLNNPHPVWTGITPVDLGSESIEDVSFDRTTLVPPLGAYMLANDGTDSEFRYASDAFSSPVPWQTGDSFSGVYKKLRSASTPGSVLAYSPGTQTTGTINITYGQGTGPASCNSGDTITINSTVNGFGHDDIGIILSTPCEATIVSTPGFVNNVSAGTHFTQWFDISGNVIGYLVYPANTSPTEMPPNTLIGQLECSPGPSVPFSMQLKLVVVAGAEVRYSSDYGATVGSAISVGNSPGAYGAFDLMPYGAASIAAADGQVKIATTLGGSYSNAAGGTLAVGQAVALVLPVRRFPHGVRQDNATDPDYILGASADNSGESLWLVDGATGTRTNITPSSGAPVAPKCVTVWQTSSIIRVQSIVNVSGVWKLYTYDGSSSTFRRNVTDPRFLRYKRLGNPALYLIDGNDLLISTDHGATWRTRTTPSGNAGRAMDPYF